MKNTYPIILTPENEGYSVYVPDFDCNTQGDNLAEAIDMGKDVIEMTGVYYQDEGKEIPSASDIKSMKTNDDQIKTFVNVDFDEYRRKVETKTVRRNVALPSWLDYEAKQAEINVSAILQNALKHALGYE